MGNASAEVRQKLGLALRVSDRRQSLIENILLDLDIIFQGVFNALLQGPGLWLFLGTKSREDKNTANEKQDSHIYPIGGPARTFRFGTGGQIYKMRQIGATTVPMRAYDKLALPLCFLKPLV